MVAEEELERIIPGTAAETPPAVDAGIREGVDLVKLLDLD
jgi:hypothetical protein